MQSDLQRLFEFVEPLDCNLGAYSHRIHELLARACIEIEANFKAILKENIYNPTDRNGAPIPEKKWNIHNYKQVNKTHHLSSYKVHVPIWDGAQSVFEPFREFEEEIGAASSENGLFIAKMECSVRTGGGDSNVASLPDTHQTGCQTNPPKAYEALLFILSAPL
jgi:hypothetical protein